ncbi:acyl-CoA dehydrogenase family protein [Acidisoma cellulosilytica]|uniref:Acyl-CoA dehydrogenase family protein n=1 Tax=Acidisoma cellulosilyticum TaxID=2802395 RepID=A0A963Z3K8_9PROT|nr:acyl-CoA dehydrogenase family protein [Acidisoma cellulosilyticum]MCB8882220.1 acyl-CoA dehydrogenase family protein [Acidisoma cellulosilyticum]
MMAYDRSNLPDDVKLGSGWGSAGDPEWDGLTKRFRPVFARIREDAVKRELGRGLPHDEIGWLRETGFTAMRVPQEAGGLGVSLVNFFALLIDLSEADSNITQALRAHFGFVEHIRTEAPPARQARWFDRLLRGDVVGAGWSELGNAKQAAFSAELRQTAEGWRLNGSKFYTTGTLFSDWVHVGASDSEGNGVSVVVSRHAPGVEVLDDWNGMGQRLTASGTTHFRDVPVEDCEIVRERAPFGYSEAFFQLVHLATLAGIGRAAASDTASILRIRKRSYSNATTAMAPEDPQLLQVVGRVRAHAYAAGAIVHHAARALDKAAAIGNDQDPALIAEAEIEIWQAQSVVSQLIIDATASLFDALGASATLRDAGLDRYWRNARTISSHNPRVYKDRIIGDFAVNGRIPQGQWRIGQA